MKLAFVCVLIATTAARAESLEEKKFWQRQRNYVDEKLKAAERACGVKFAFEWESPATLRAEAEKTKHSPNGVCTTIVETVSSLCRAGEDEKAAVKAKITGFTCGFAKERTLE